MKPGAMTRPRASMTRAPDGIWTWLRLPAATIESPLRTTTESNCGARPEPSINVAPTIAVVSSAACEVNNIAAASKTKRRLIGVFNRSNPRLLLVRGYVILELFAVRIVRLLLQKLFILGRCQVLHANSIIESREPQVSISFADRIEFNRLVEVAYGFRTFFDLKIRLAEIVI